METVTLTIDESWQPYVQARMTCAAPVSADPIASDRLTLTLTERDETGTILTSVTAVNLSIRVTDADEETGTVNVNATSAESDIQDRAYLYSPATIGPSVWDGIREGLEDILTMADVDPADVDLTALPYLTSPDLATGAVFKPGDPWWPTLSDIPQRIGWHLWCGLDGIWRVSEADPTPTAPVATVAVGVDIEELRTTRTRNGTGPGAWGDAVACVYEWTDGTGAHRIIGTAAATATAGHPTKVIRVNSAVPVTQGQADARAASLLSRVYARGTEYLVTIPARYDLRPRTFINLVTTSGTVLVYVAAVAWSLPAATATLTLREAS